MEQSKEEIIKRLLKKGFTAENAEKTAERIWEVRTRVGNAVTESRPKWRTVTEVEEKVKAFQQVTTDELLRMAEKYPNQPILEKMINYTGAITTNKVLEHMTRVRRVEDFYLDKMLIVPSNIRSNIPLESSFTTERTRLLIHDPEKEAEAFKVSKEGMKRVMQASKLAEDAALISLHEKSKEPSGPKKPKLPDKNKKKRRGR